MFHHFALSMSCPFFSQFPRHLLSGRVKTIRRSTVALVIGACAFTALSAPARADIVWNFTYSGGTFPNYGPHFNQPDYVTGQLTTTDLNTATNTYKITGISGTDNGSSITGLDAVGYTDNLLHASTPHLDFYGFSFTTAAGDDVNLYYNAANGYYWDWFDYGRTIVENGNFSASQVPAAVPEPTSTALLGAGFLLFAVLGRKRCSTHLRA